MLEKTYQIGWFRGLPEDTKSTGVQVEILDLEPPKPLANQISFTLRTTTDVAKTFANLLSTKSIIPRLSLVVRTDTKLQSDLAYNMADVQIVSVQPTTGLPTATTISARFGKLELVATLGTNPGPPPGAPKVHGTGMNLGWIYSSSQSSHTSGMPIMVNDFAAPSFNGRLKLALAKPSSYIENLIRGPVSTRDLVLVLPDRTTRRYVEFKFRNAKVSLLDDAMHIAFESDVIECLTGETIQ